VEDDWMARWETLSHGERKRAQIGVALWRQPRVLAVDEPTNHIDAAARRLLVGALRAYRGVGLLVSHDRELLDGLCRQCLFVDPPGATLRPGGYSAGTAQARIEEETARHQREIASREVARLEREAGRREQEASRADKRRSKRGLGKDNDARFRRNLARVTGRDGVGGRLLRQLDGRVQQARERKAQIEVRKVYELGIWLPEGRSRRNFLLSVPAGALPLGGGRSLRFPDLVMRPDDRIAVTGPNGGGKSTLIRHLLPRINAPVERVVYMPQEVGARESRRIMAQARRLPPAELGRMMTVVSRLGSRPERLLESAEPSPGEVRKVLLAMGIARVPHIVVMDEPTNHLDLPSIECMEEALARCPCGLLLVSHDFRFLAQLTRKRWQVRAAEAEGTMELTVVDG
jgi:ATPase subunit of ABC transporter with duplicated ATPase domains